MLEFKYLKSIEQGEKTLCVLMDGSEVIFDKRINKVVDDILLLFGTTIENSQSVNEKLFKTTRLAPIIASTEYGIYFFTNVELNNRRRSDVDVYVFDSYPIKKVKDNKEGGCIVTYRDKSEISIPMSKYHFTSQLKRCENLRDYFKGKLTRYAEYFKNNSKEGDVTK